MRQLHCELRDLLRSSTCAWPCCTFQSPPSACPARPSASAPGPSLPQTRCGVFSLHTVILQVPYFRYSSFNSLKAFPAAQNTDVFPYMLHKSISVFLENPEQLARFFILLLLSYSRESTSDT